MIKNKLKISLFVLGFLALAFVGAGVVHAADLTWSSDTTVTINGNDYIIRSGSEATSLVVNSTNLVVVVPSSSTFTLASEDGYTMPNTQGLIETCSGLVSTLAFPGSGTITITPYAAKACNQTATGGSSRSTSTTTTTTTTETTFAETTTVDEFDGCNGRSAGFSVTTGKSCVGNTAAPVVEFEGCDGRNTGFSTTTGKSCVGNTVTYIAPKAYAFGTTLVKSGATGEACRAWQTFLNEKAGNNLALDGVCGPLTMAAARAWQASAGLTADGLLGPASRAKALSQ